MEEPITKNRKTRNKNHPQTQQSSKYVCKPWLSLPPHPERRKKQMKKPNIYLPEDLLLDILSRLPVKSIKRCTSVCKPWLSLLTHPTFIKLHFHRASTLTPNLLLELELPIFTNTNTKFITLHSSHTLPQAEDLNLGLPPDLQVLGSCNGLICLSSFERFSMVLLNPSTREHMQLPSVTPYIRDCVYLGFGYVSYSNVYKVVVISEMFQGRVYTTGTNLWKTVKVTAPSLPCFPPGSGRAIHLNGVLHWRGSCRSGYQRSTIVSFDLKDEEFGEVAWPDSDKHLFANSYWDKVPFEIKWEPHQLGVLNGCLAIFHHFLRDYHLMDIDIWMMKSYGVDESWIKVYSFPGQPIGNIITPLDIRKNGDILLLERRAHLLLYDPTAKAIRTVDSSSADYPRFSAYTYVETLTSIASLPWERSGRQG